ncbi:PHOsphatase [Blyttiomyces sp. JEL0837]|nr:PHOsphatase [Blyttiomyces sp. JEL0837]
MLEYYDDLKHWWDYSYGVDLGGRSGFGFEDGFLGCAGVSEVVKEAEKLVLGSQGDVVNSMKKKAIKKRKVKGFFGFGHSDSVVFLATALGLFHDTEPLYANKTTTHLYTRNFATSKIAHMGSSITFETYSCNNKPKPQQIQFRILVNEIPIKIPKCESMYCSLDTLKNVLGDKIGCDFEGRCGIRFARPDGDGDGDDGDFNGFGNIDNVFVVQKDV